MLSLEDDEAVRQSHCCAVAYASEARGERFAGAWLNSHSPVSLDHALVQIPQLK